MLHTNNNEWEFTNKKIKAHRVQWLQTASSVDPDCCFPRVPACSDLPKWAVLHHDLHPTTTDWLSSRWKSDASWVKLAAFADPLWANFQDCAWRKQESAIQLSVFISNGLFWQEHHPRECANVMSTRDFLAQMNLGPKHKPCSSSGVHWGQNRWSHGLKWPWVLSIRWCLLVYSMKSS